MRYITPIEYIGEGWRLAIGKAAPWDRRLQVRVPKWMALIFSDRNRT